MVHKLSPILLVLFTIIPTCMTGSLQAAGNRPPAGQMCADGSYVSGFDADGNIICAVPGGAKPVISDLKPSWVVFGARETSIAIIRAGNHPAACP